jgi:hypothetical protein
MITVDGEPRDDPAAVKRIDGVWRSGVEVGACRGTKQCGGLGFVGTTDRGCT